MEPAALLWRQRLCLWDGIASKMRPNAADCLLGKRHFAYYRFHKRVGKGNWNRYVERYTKPRSIENTQNITFNYRASFQAAKLSAAYLWELPKRIATATSANEVLDAWIHFRHKRKKAYHYVLALRRLCEIGQVDTSDWRFQFLLKKLLRRSKYFIDLPGVCRYLGELKSVPSLDKLSIQIGEKIERYTPAQLASIAAAFGNCRLHSKHLFSLLARQLESKLQLASTRDLTDIAAAFAKCMVYNHGLFATISAEVQKRFSDEFKTHAVYPEINSTPNRHCMMDLQAPVMVQERRPSTHELLALVEAFSHAKHRDATLCDILSHKLRAELAEADAKRVVDPHVLTRALRAYARLKVNDIPLFIDILDNAARYPYNYPPLCLSEIGRQLAAVLPRQVDSVARNLNTCLAQLRERLRFMDPRGLTNTAVLAYKVCASSAEKPEILREVGQALVGNGAGRVRYDAPKMLETLAMHKSLDGESFGMLCRDIYRVVDMFEPADYQRTSRVLRKLRRDNMVNLKMVNMLAKHVLGRWEEFGDFQYHCVARDLTLAGPPSQALLRGLWSHNRYSKGYRPNGLLAADVASQ